MAREILHSISRERVGQLVMRHFWITYETAYSLIPPIGFLFNPECACQLVGKPVAHNIRVSMSLHL